MTTNEQKLANVTTAIYGVPAPLRTLITAKLATEAALKRAQSESLTGLLWQAQEHCHPQLDGAAGASQLESWMHRSGGKELDFLARFHAALAAIEAHPDMPEAKRLLDPLLSERDRLVAAIAAETAAHAAAVAAAENAHRLAMERAAAAAAADPAVAAAAAALAALTTEPAPPPPPFRGKVEVGKRDDNDVISGMIEEPAPAPHRPQRRQQAQPVFLAEDTRPGSNYRPPLQHG
jgi:hypothetical protein